MRNLALCHENPLCLLDFEADAQCNPQAANSLPFQPKASLNSFSFTSLNAHLGYSLYGLASWIETCNYIEYDSMMIPNCESTGAMPMFEVILIIWWSNSNHILLQMLTFGADWLNIR